MTGARLELLVLAALLLLAALLRLPGLDVRGTWDADQGQDMLILHGLVTRGEIPLLGPMTSIGTFHHGAVYYWLLAPAAFASGADPVAVTGWISLFGLGAVAGTWWLGRLVGGPVAGALAGLFAAISPAAIDESTFIWNPNLVPAASALAFAAVLHARATGRDRWWVVAGLGAMVTMQCHVLGVVVAVPVVAAWAVEARARRRSRRPLGGLAKAGAGAVLVIAAGYLPLLVHELGHGFAETRAILDYVSGGGASAGTGIVERILLVAFRAVSWPMAALLTDRPVAAAVAAVAAIGMATLASLRGAALERSGARWLAVSILFAVAALAVAAPSLATVTPGLPNDHYHAFLDPLVLALTATGIVRVARGGLFGLGTLRPKPGGGEPAGADVVADAGADGGAACDPRVPRLGRAMAGVLAAILVLVGVGAWPPLVAPDGGWRTVDAAAVRVAETTAGATVGVTGIPAFKSANALRFPLVRRGVPLADIAGAGMVVVVCDPLFERVVGAACGGPAEEAWVAAGGEVDLHLVDRFEAGSRRMISIYQRAQDAAATP